MTRMKTFENRGETAPTWERLVQAHVHSLRFGTVQIVVHGGRVVQVERTEKVRLDDPDHRSQESGG